jgi:hypothetical protein
MDMDRLANQGDLRENARDIRVTDVRASDADRAATAELLQRHYAAGRLETQEFEERVRRCYAARTIGELRALVVDLAQSLAPELGLGRADDGRHQVWRFAMIAPLVLALVAVVGLTGAHALWLAWPLAFFAVRAGLWRRWSW